jgi:signal transduction histidine kinase
MPGLIQKIQSSIFVKLLLILIITAILINLLVFTAYRIVFSPHAKTVFQKNIVRYVNYIIQDIGIPPDPSRAKVLSKDLSIQIRYESPKTRWSTSEQLPSIEQVQKIGRSPLFNHWDPYTKTGWYRGRFFMVVETGTGQFLFSSDFKQYIDVPEKLIAILLLLLTFTLVGAYFYIQRILKPIKWLTEGVNQVSSGNLRHQIPEGKKDELGELAKSFNAMTRQINEMIRAKEQLLLDISHELRSPITRMKIALEFLQDETMKESIREDLMEMEGMITEILETERLNSPHGKLDLKKSDLSELIREVSENFQDKPPGIKRISFTQKVFLTLDRERIKTVLKNILENAIKYSKPESQPIEISVAEEENSILIQIKDHGSGISKEELPFVFEPFYRVDRSRSKETGGYGLGLSLCKKIMEAHGGTIEMSSNLNIGTTVFLRFTRF